MCSLSDLVGLNPADLVTKLKLLFSVVITLFGCMLLGAVIGFRLDTLERARMAASLCDPAAGFRVTKGGAWLWRFGLDELPDDLASPCGPAVQARRASCAHWLRSWLFVLHVLTPNFALPSPPCNTAAVAHPGHAIRTPAGQYT